MLGLPDKTPDFDYGLKNEADTLEKETKNEDLSQQKQQKPSTSKQQVH